MATDYDAPRRNETDDLAEDSLEELKARRNEAQSAVVDVDESDTAESFELPGADLSGEELSVRVLPRQADEFTCSSCFLVHHRSQLASEKNGQAICKECAEHHARVAGRPQGRPGSDVGDGCVRRSASPGTGRWRSCSSW